MEGKKVAILGIDGPKKATEVVQESMNRFKEYIKNEQSKENEKNKEKKQSEENVKEKV